MDELIRNILAQQKEFRLELRSVWKRIDRLTILTTVLVTALALKEGINLLGAL